MRPPSSEDSWCRRKMLPPARCAWQREVPPISLHWAHPINSSQPMTPRQAFIKLTGCRWVPNSKCRWVPLFSHRNPAYFNSVVSPTAFHGAAPQQGVRRTPEASRQPCRAPGGNLLMRRRPLCPATVSPRRSGKPFGQQKGEFLEDGASLPQETVARRTGSLPRCTGLASLQCRAAASVQAHF